MLVDVDPPNVTDGSRAGWLPSTVIDVSPLPLAEYGDVSSTPVSVTVSSRGEVVPPTSIPSVSPFDAIALADADAVFSTPVRSIVG
ncbi:hypothetical protein, partial [Halorubrum ezzemoulense]